MGTLYGHGKGKAGSHRPLNLKPEWNKLTGKDVEQIVVQLAQKGVGEAKVGLILRDNYGVPNIKAKVGKSVKQIYKECLEDSKERVPYDLMNLIKKIKRVRKHFEDNKKDMTAKKGVQLTEAKIKRLENYYKKTKVFPSDWDYKKVKV